MKIECNVIKDLLPIYIDNCCSIESKQLIAEHLKECELCNDSYKHMKASIIDMAEDNSCVQEKHDEIIIKKGIKRLRRLWIISLATVIVMIAIALIIKNEIRGEGLCFTNIDDLHKSKQFLNAIKNDDFEKAFKYLNIEKAYNLVNSPRPIDINQYQEIAKEYFIKDLQLLTNNGFKITGSKFASANRCDTDWWFEFNIYMKNSHGKNENIGKLVFTTNKNGILPSSCISVFNSNLDEADKIICVMSAISDWRYETYDNITGQKQFERIKEHEVWR